MRAYYIHFATAILLSGVAIAKMRLSSDEFGRAEAMYDFCVHADSKSASKYQERKGALVRGAQEKDIADARKTQEYRTSYSNMSASLGELSDDQARQTCTAVLRAENVPNAKAP